MGLKPNPKTIYGIETGSKDHMGFNTVGTGKSEGKPDLKTIYGIETEPKDHIWDSTQLGQENLRGNRTQRPYMGFNTVGTGKPEGKPDPKTIYGIQHSWDRKT